jgi:hypothetical protein
VATYRVCFALIVALLKSFAPSLTKKVPRVTLFFPAEDLEPTPEFETLIKKVQQDRNINDLRELHRNYGHFFCQEVLLGGCLQTSKMIQAKELAQESMERSKFKAQVGSSVSIPGVASQNWSGSHEKQDQSEQGSKETETHEKMTFDATGGNTLLAIDPPTWLASLANFEFWRVIERRELTPIADVIAGMPSPGYKDAKTWFLRAIPRLSEYFIIPPSRQIDVRLRSLLPLNSLPHEFNSGGNNEQQVEDDVKPNTYLGHNPDFPIRPVHGCLERSPTGGNVTVEAVARVVYMDLTQSTYQLATQDRQSFNNPQDSLHARLTNQDDSRAIDARQSWNEGDQALFTPAT